VAFDLLTALLDSWSLWRAVAKDAARGMAWRAQALRLMGAAGDYRAYDRLVQEAAEQVGVAEGDVKELLARWGELDPLPYVRPALQQLRLPLAIVTNCSQELAKQAAARVGVAFDVVVSAERAGAYKPDPRPYRWALEELGRSAPDVLFVAGSPHDVVGAAAVGMPVYWANRGDADLPPAAQPRLIAPDLRALVSELETGPPRPVKSWPHGL